MLFSPPLQCQTNPPHRILLVEDDLCISQMNAAALTRFGYAVVVVHDGAAAWEALHEDYFDLMLTDNDMPNVTGVELLKKLRADRMELPVIMTTLTIPKAEFARSPWFQPAATLVKPFTIAELLRTVKKVLREAEGATDNFQLVMRDLKDDKVLQGEESANPGPRILVVDGDSALRQLYVEALAQPGFFVDVTEDGAGGWEALQSNSYALLITENDVPKLSGVELVMKLRAAHMALPVVMAAARLPAYELARNPALQLAATLVKPFAVVELLNTVKIVLHATKSFDGPLAAQAIATQQSFQKIRKQNRPSSHWGLNE